MTPLPNDPTAARKRRKEIIQSQRSENEIGGGAALASDGFTSTAASLLINSMKQDPKRTIPTNGDDKKPPKKRKVTSGDSSTARTNGKKGNKLSSAGSNSNAGDENKKKKTQIRYDPEVPMSKDQLAAWRREARRVRNRESAAASRQRIRNRISELEDEVGEWKSKYNHAMQRLEALEKCVASNEGEQRQEEQLTSQQGTKNTEL